MAYHSPVSTGLSGRCPKCGEGALFKGFLKFNEHCESCGADFTMEDAGDGPAFFVMTIVMFVFIPIVIGFQFLTDAPGWLVFLIWGPILVLACIGLLRPFRGIMFNMQWVKNAQQVRAKDFSKHEFKAQDED